MGKIILYSIVENNLDLQFMTFDSFIIQRVLFSSVSGFLAIGLTMGAEYSTPLLLMELGFIAFTVALLLLMQFFLFKVHKLNTSLRTLRRAAEDLESVELVRAVEELEPVSGYGLFTADRATLTSTVSVILTYLIVLLQFKQSHIQK